MEMGGGLTEQPLINTTNINTTNINTTNITTTTTTTTISTTATTTPILFFDVEERKRNMSAAPGMMAIPFVYTMEGGVMTFDFEGKKVEVPKNAFYVMISIELLMALLGVAGNFLMLLLLMCVRQARAVNGIKFITSVHISSFCALCVIVLRSSAMETSMKINSETEVTCNLKFGFYYLFVISNMYNRLLVGVDRYLYISKGLKYHVIMTSSLSRCCLAFIWVISIMAAILCTYYEHEKIPVLVIVFFFPTLCLAVIYFTIFQWAYIQTRAIKEKENTIKNLILMDDKIFIEEEKGRMNSKSTVSSSYRYSVFVDEISHNMRAQRLTHSQIANLYRDVSRFVAELERDSSHGIINSIRGGGGGGGGRSGGREGTQAPLQTPEEAGEIAATTPTTTSYPSLTQPSRSYPVTKLATKREREEEAKATPMNMRHATSSTFLGESAEVMTRKVAATAVARAIAMISNESEVDPPRLSEDAKAKISPYHSTTRPTVLFSQSVTDHAALFARDTPQSSVSAEGSSIRGSAGGLVCEACRALLLDEQKTHARSACKRSLYRSCYFLYFCCCSSCYWRRKRKEENAHRLSCATQESSRTGRHIETTAGTDSVAYQLHQTAKIFDIFRHFLFQSRRRSKEISLRRAVMWRFWIRVLKLIVVIAFIFSCNAGLWMPLCITQVYNTVTGNRFDFFTFKTLYIVAMFSFVLDPIVFGFLNQQLRVAVHHRFNFHVSKDNRKPGNEV